MDKPAINVQGSAGVLSILSALSAKTSLILLSKDVQTLVQGFLLKKEPPYFAERKMPKTSMSYMLILSAHPQSN